MVCAFPARARVFGHSSKTPPASKLANTPVKIWTRGDERGSHGASNHFILSDSQGRVHRCTHRGGGVEGVARLQEPMVRIHFPPAGESANFQFLNSNSAHFGKMGMGQGVDVAIAPIAAESSTCRSRGSVS